MSDVKLIAWKDRTLLYQFVARLKTATSRVTNVAVMYYKC